MQEIKDKALEIINNYEEQLASKGIRIILSKKYVETEVEERSGGYANAGQAVFNIIDRAGDRKKEKRKGYNFERNKYHSLVITVAPLGKNPARCENCREYAFVLKKVERAHLGQGLKRRVISKPRCLQKSKREY